MVVVLASGMVVHRNAPSDSRAGLLGVLRRQHEPDVGVLVGGFVAGRRHRHDRDVDDPTVGPGDEIVEPGLLPAFAHRDSSGSTSPGSPCPPTWSQACWRACQRKSTCSDGGCTIIADAVTCKWGRSIPRCRQRPADHETRREVVGL